MPSLPSLTSSLLLSSALALLWGCSHSSPEGDDAAPDAKADDATPDKAPEPEPEPEPEPTADAVVKELSVDTSELSASDDGATLEYCLDCRRKASTYTYCEFDKAAFEAAVGAENMDETLSLRVKMVEKNSETSVPDDPSAPQPHGGFTHVRHTCTVDAVLAAE